MQVARLAGLPAAVVERARVVLEALEHGDREGGGKARALVDDLPLFAAAARPGAAAAPPPRPSRPGSREILPDELTPRDALALVYELHGARSLRVGSGSISGACVVHELCMHCASDESV